MKDYLLCGKIVNTHGVSGDVKVLPYTDNTAFFDGIKKVSLESMQVLTPVSFKPHKNAIIMRFKEIDTMDKAEKLKNEEIYVKRAEAPPLPEGRHYIVDLIGLEVVTDSGRGLGKITDVLQTGSNDVYIVNGDREYLIPVIDEVVLNIDTEKRIVLIKPLKGLLDDED